MHWCTQDVKVVPSELLFSSCHWCVLHRRCTKETENCFSDAQQESSDEDVEWSGNSSLFANLSIPQLDGAADESSGESSYTETPLKCRFALMPV